MPHAKGCFCPSSSQWSQRNGWGFRSSPGTPDLALPLLQAVLMAPWQFSWLALSQGLSSMGERPFRGSEAWEMFIAWPQRRWRANWERHRAKAAQAALQSQVSHSKGQSRAGEEKLLLASTDKKTLPVTAQNPAGEAVPAKGVGMSAPGHPSHALQEQREGWLGTLVTAGACGSLWQGGLWDSAEELQVLTSSSVPVLGKERQCQGLPRGKQVAESSAIPIPGS